MSGCFFWGAFFCCVHGLVFRFFGVSRAVDVSGCFRLLGLLGFESRVGLSRFRGVVLGVSSLARFRCSRGEACSSAAAVVVLLGSGWFLWLKVCILLMASLITISILVRSVSYGFSLVGQTCRCWISNS